MNDNEGDGALPEPVPAMRASDDDREVVVTRLREAAGRGQIDLDELEARIAATYEARTLPELAPLTADLPPARPEASPQPPARSAPAPGSFADVMTNAGFKMHFSTYVLVIGFLVGIWAITGFGHPWPFYPAAGWGIGLGSHYQAVSLSRQRGKQHDEIPDQHWSSPKIPRPPWNPPPAVPAPPHPIRDREAERAAKERERDERRDARRSSRPGSAAAGRRFVVAMFVDVVGSTQLNEALGDEGWVEVRDRFRRLVDDASTSAGGFEANSSGDGVLVRFDHPSGAAKAAVEIMRRLDTQRRESGFAPSVRIGIHSGDAVADGDDIIGAVVNLASRVTGAAEPDEILCTEHVADHVGGGYATTGRGLHSLKGITQPRHLLAIEWR